VALEDYARKRSFDKTPEPPPSKAKLPGADRRFYIQRHNARRLHYDFRLEIGGTLKSWAVPKGPTLDPGEKRLAMMVEDHPLDYGDFEGNIPAGNYGAGSVMVWDRGTYELLGDKPAEEQIARGDLKFRLHGTKLNGEFALVLMKGRGKGNEWLLLKKKDQFAQPGWNAEQQSRSALTNRTQEEIAQNLSELPAAKPGSVAPSKLKGATKAAMPGAVVPMKAIAAEAPPEGPDWVYELKWDGVRTLCFIKKSGVHLVSRSGNSADAQYPELSVIPHYVAAETAILDGEIAVLDPQGRPRFELIQPRIMVSDPNSIAHLARSRPVIFFAFDLLYLDGYDLRQCSLEERKRALETILTPCPVLRYSAHFSGSGKDFLAAAREHELEGVMAKRRESCYESKRSRDWLKVKIVAHQEFVICGYTKGERGGYFGALVLGVYEGDALVWVGNVGTGFDQVLLEKIYGMVEPLATSRCPFREPPKIPHVTWTRPEVVCEVKFANWTTEHRLRAPVFLGLRLDSNPHDCVREVPQPPPVEDPSAPRAETRAESPPANGPGTQRRRRRAAPAPHKANGSDASISSAGSNAGANEKKAARVDKRRKSSGDGAEAALALSRAPLLTGKAESATLEIDGRRLKFTNLNKILYPAEGYTKRDVLNYYDSVSPLILPHLRDRPLSLKRYPNGIEEPFFFQKEAAESFPPWLRTEPIYSEHNKAPINYVVCDDRASLLYLTNLACIDENPWMSRIGSLENPDFILIDLDPQDCGYDRIVDAAQLVRRKLDLLQLEGYPKTTGGDGMHLYIPLEPRYTYAQARGVAEILARIVSAERPDLFTTPRAVARREKGKVYFDWAQISESKTIAASYVLRAYRGAPVSTPLAWREVARGLSPAQFNIANALERFERVGDLFAPVLNNLQRLEPALEKLEEQVRKIGR